MLHTSLHHWFFIGFTLHSLAWYSLIHCIGTSHWLLLLIGNSHWLLNWISLDWNHHDRINGSTEMSTVSHWMGHLLGSIIGHWLKLILNLVHNIPINTRT